MTPSDSGSQRIAADRGPATTHVVVVRTRHPGVDPAAREATTQSLLAQTYPDWSLVDGPENGAPGTVSVLPFDPPVPERATDVLVVSAPDGAIFDVDAIAQLVNAAHRSGARLITWDLDLDDAGTAQPQLRFGWSPETLLSCDYTHGCFALRRQDYLAAAAAVPGDVPLTAWSLLLHLPPDLDPTLHLPHPLTRIPALPPVDDGVAVPTIDAALRHRGIPASCVRKDGVTRLRWHPESWPRVSLLVPTRHNEPMLGPLLDSLRHTEGPSFDVVIVDNGEHTPEHEAWYQRDWGFPVRVHWWQEAPFHYGRVNNAAAGLTDADVIVLLNDDTRVADPGWLAELVGWAAAPGVGCAGSVLLDGDGRIQHAGVWLGIGGYAGHLFGGLRPGEDTVIGPTDWYRNTTAVTAACLAIRRELFREVGGLDERMVLCGSDVTLGLDLLARGLRNVCSPLPGVVHLESVTRSGAPRHDQEVSLVRYQPWHDMGDPYGNPRLSLRTTRPTLRAANEPDPVADARHALGVIV